MAESLVGLDETWPVDETYFEGVEESHFMEFLQLFPVIYDSSLKAFKNATAKKNAKRTVAKKFKGSEDMVTRRYATIRTRVGRHLNKYRKSGSGTDDNIPVPPELNHLRWLFKFIKTKSTVSNLPVPQISIDDDDEENSNATATTSGTQECAEGTTHSADASASNSSTVGSDQTPRPERPGSANSLTQSG